MRICVAVRHMEDGRRCVRQLEKLAENVELVMEIVCYSEIRLLLHDIILGEKYPDIIYLGVSKDKHGDFEAARKIRKKGYRGPLILLSDSACYALRGYEIDVMAYLVKGTSSPFEFDYTFYRAVKKTRYHERMILQVKVHKQQKSIPISEIYYVEMLNRELYVYSERGKTACRMAIGKMEEKLQEMGFLRVHRSFIINSVYVKTISRKTLEMRNSSIIPIGPNYRKGVFEELYKRKERKNMEHIEVLEDVNTWKQSLISEKEDALDKKLNHYVRKKIMYGFILSMIMKNE